MGKQGPVIYSGLTEEQRKRFTQNFGPDVCAFFDSEQTLHYKPDEQNASHWFHHPLLAEHIQTLPGADKVRRVNRDGKVFVKGYKNITEALHSYWAHSGLSALAEEAEREEQAANGQHSFEAAKDEARHSEDAAQVVHRVHVAKRPRLKREREDEGPAPHPHSVATTAGAETPAREGPSPSGAPAERDTPTAAATAAALVVLASAPATRHSVAHAPAGPAEHSPLPLPVPLPLPPPPPQARRPAMPLALQQPVQALVLPAAVQLPQLADPAATARAVLAAIKQDASLADAFVDVLQPVMLRRAQAAKARLDSLQQLTEAATVMLDYLRDFSGGDVYRRWLPDLPEHAAGEDRQLRRALASLRQQALQLVPADAESAAASLSATQATVDARAAHLAALAEKETKLRTRALQEPDQDTRDELLKAATRLEGEVAAAESAVETAQQEATRLQRVYDAACAGSATDASTVRGLEQQVWRWLEAAQAQVRAATEQLQRYTLQV